MSFSQEVRQELSLLTASARHCNLAELAAIVGMVGEISVQEPERFSEPEGRKEEEGERCGASFYRLRIRTENIAVVRKVFTLLQKTFNIRSDVSVHIHRGEKSRGCFYSVCVNDPAAARSVLRALKFPEPALAADPLLVQQPCCRRAFIRGAFLSSGSISNPERSYHFEIACSSEARAAQLQKLIRAFGPDAKIVQRKKYYIVYIKEGGQIVDMLNIMGAHVSLMNLENIRIVRDMRNTVNRKVNCEAANINKTVNAAVRQTEDIRYLKAVKGLGGLPAGLADIAELRLVHPDASLKELGEMLVPPVGKSGVNHRLRKLSRLAEEVRQNKEELL